MTTTTKYYIMKNFLTTKKIPEDIQDMIFDNMVPEHQKINIVDNMFQTINIYILGIEKNHTYLMTTIIEDYNMKVEDELFYYEESAEDIKYINFVKLDDWLDDCNNDSECDYDEDGFHGALERKKEFEINIRQRFSFYKLYEKNDTLKNNSMIDESYENKKKYCSQYIEKNWDDDDY